MAVQPLKVAVCILTYNRMAYLAKTLDSLSNVPGGYDLFVYDNGSNDGSKFYVESAYEAGELTGYDINNGDNHSTGYGMNRAIEMALKVEPDIILFSADDYVYHPDWFAKFTAFWNVAPPRIKLASLNIEPVYPWNAITYFIEHGGVRGIARTTVGGSQWSFRASDVDLIYPLREITGGEDLEVCRRLIGNGYQIVALDLSEHVGEKESVWGNQSWTYAKQVPGEVMAWIKDGK